MRLALGFLIGLFSTCDASVVPFGGSKKRPESTPPHEFLFELCQSRRLTCVIDLTAKQACPVLIHNTTASSPSAFSEFVKVCPQYKWRKEAGIFIVESNDASDSALNVKVGPLTKSPLDIADAFTQLLMMGKIEIGNPAAGYGGIEHLQASRPPLVKIRFKLGRDTLKSDMIEGAKQLRPSIWEIYRTSESTFFWNVDSARLTEPMKPSK